MLSAGLEWVTVFFLTEFHVNRLLCRQLGFLITSRDVSACPYRAQGAVPKCEERLTEVRLDAPTLMVDVMVARVVAREPLERIKRKRVSAMVVYGLKSAAGKKPHSLSSRHSGEFEGYAGA